MKSAKNSDEVITWQEAHAFMPGVNEFTRQFQKEEIYSLTAQFRRAAISVAANIAEGFKRRSSLDNACSISRKDRSKSVKCYVRLSHHLAFRNKEHLQQQADEVGRILASYIFAVERRHKLKS